MITKEDILELLERTDQPLTAVEVGQALNLPVGRQVITVKPQLNALALEGTVRRVAHPSGPPGYVRAKGLSQCLTVTQTPDDLSERG